MKVIIEFHCEPTIQQVAAVLLSTATNDHIKRAIDVYVAEPNLRSSVTHILGNNEIRIGIFEIRRPENWEPQDQKPEKEDEE